MPVRKVGIYIDPKGSEIYLDNELRGFSPLILYLPLGVYKAKAKHKDCTTLEWIINVEPFSRPLIPYLPPIYDLVYERQLDCAPYVYGEG